MDKPHSGVDSPHAQRGQVMDKAWITPWRELPTPCPQPAHTVHEACPHLHKTGLTHTAHIPGGYVGTQLFSFYIYVRLPRLSKTGTD